jgi:hypothetical protein
LRFIFHHQKLAERKQELLRKKGENYIIEEKMLGKAKIWVVERKNG